MKSGWRVQLGITLPMNYMRTHSNDFVKQLTQLDQQFEEARLVRLLKQKCTNRC